MNARAALVLGFLSACGGHTSATPAGSTGAFAIVTINGKQKLYLPLKDNGGANAKIAVVDVGVAGSGVTGQNAQVTAIDLGTSDFATSTGGDETMIIAASTDYPDVWVIDPKTDAVTRTLKLDPSFGASTFSGGGGYVTGVAMDSAHHRAILSVWNGFMFVNTQSGGSLGSVTLAAPSENFGFDATAQRVIAPFYQCAKSTSSGNPPTTCNDYKAPDSTVVTDGLNVIDLTDGTVYTYQNVLAVDQHAPVGLSPDGAAVDPTTGVVVVPSEIGNSADMVPFENVIDMKNAQFDKVKKTFTAPNHVIKNQALPGVAIEPVHHLAFFMQERQPDVGVVDLSAANIGGGTFLHATIPSPPNSVNPWRNTSDPHGIATATLGKRGTPVGFVVDDTQTWVARIDLQAMMALPQANGKITDISSTVTFLNARSR